MNPDVFYLAVDPGERNGVCGYSINGRLLWMQSVNYNTLATFLEELTDVYLCVLEDYKIYPNKAKDHIYSDVIGARAIGKVENWTERHNVKVVKQGSKVLDMGFKYLGKKPPPKPDRLNDPMCAHAHFTYYAVNNGIINPKELI